MNTSGKCLCGSVELTVELQNKEAAACHCSMCRRWAGAPMLSIESGSAPTIKGEEHVGKFDSSDWAERTFCTKCGTHLYYRLKPAEQYHIPAGLLAAEPDLKLTHQIFIEEKPDYYEFANETTNMTGAEVFAYFEENS